MPARPLSPTSLLWAHQIKRENAHLLSRMKAIETDLELIKHKTVTIDAVNKEIRQTVKSCADLEVRVRLIEEDDKEQQMKFAALDKDRHDRIEMQMFTLTDVEKRVEVLQAHYRNLEVGLLDKVQRDGETAFTKVEKLETTFHQFVEATAGKQSVSAVNESLIHAMNQKIMQLEYKMKEEWNGIMTLNERLKPLEQTNTAANEEQRQVSLSNANLKHKLQRLVQNSEVGTPSPSVDQAFAPNSPLAKRRIEIADIPPSKKQARPPKISTAREPTRGPLITEKKSHLRGPRPSQRFRT
jgi:chromosome segregation ATPase